MFVDGYVGEGLVRVSKPGQTVKFEPGATPLDVVGLTEPLRAGQKLSGTLRLSTPGLSALSVKRLTRPGGELRTPSILAAIPFVVIALLGGISLGTAPSSHWDAMIAGDAWLECLLSIPIIAIAPFAITIWVVRQAAPTDLVRAGAFAGLIAGGISAMAYALHCMDDSLPFVAVWYGGTIVLCTLAGAALGPRLLRW